MNAAEYAEYRESAGWKERRRRCLSRYGGRCQVCGCTTWRRIVDAHHLHYRNVGDEKPEDLIPLCRLHHDLIHEQPDGYGIEVVKRLRSECKQTHWDDPEPGEAIRLKDAGWTIDRCPHCQYEQDRDPEWPYCSACDLPFSSPRAYRQSAMKDQIDADFLGITRSKEMREGKAWNKIGDMFVAR